MKRLLLNKGFNSFLASLVSVICGLIIGLVIMFIFNPQGAWDGFIIMIQGGFSDSARGIGNVLYYATSFILIGLSVSFSFQTGVFNIGAIGQFTIGSFVTIYVAHHGTWLPAPIQWLVAIICGGIVGALWGIIPGVMKAYKNVNEVISCIMMNYIAMYLVNQLIYDSLYDNSLVGTRYVPTTSLMPRVGLDKIFPGSSVNLGFFIALLVSVLVYILLYKTTFGFELRACGFNPNAAHYAGVNEKRNIVLVMIIAGFLAGLGGGILHLSSISKYYKISEVFLNETNYAIPIALLANTHPIGVIASGIFISYITVGGTLMQGQGFPVETVDMITAVIIYFAAFSLVFKQFFTRITTLKFNKANKKRIQ
ncbi:MAG: ABC transporter permease [Clostridiaceae bacterium]|nr:ABC transporter permease [Clostridiaceae bacterium]